MISHFYKTILHKKRVSAHIVQMEFNLGFLLINTWIINNNGNTCVIDTGMGSMGLITYESAAALGNVQGIFLTHGHSDHAGGLNLINSKYSNIPIYLNKQDFEYVYGIKPFPRRRFKHSIVNKNVSLNNIEKGTDMLEKMGLKMLYSSGHSPGHVSFYHSKDNVLIAGDLFTSKNGNLGEPMKIFTAYFEESVKNGEKLLDELSPKLVLLSHGKLVHYSNEMNNRL